MAKQKVEFVKEVPARTSGSKGRRKYAYVVEALQKAKAGATAKWPGGQGGLQGARDSYPALRFIQRQGVVYVQLKGEGAGKAVKARKAPRKRKVVVGVVPVAPTAETPATE